MLHKGRDGWGDGFVGKTLTLKVEGKFDLQKPHTKLGVVAHHCNPSGDKMEAKTGRSPRACWPVSLTGLTTSRAERRPSP